MHKLTNLPPEYNFDDPAILRALNLASRALAELKGESKTIPNSDILINTMIFNIYHHIRQFIEINWI